MADNTINCVRVSSSYITGRESTAFEVRRARYRDQVCAIFPPFMFTFGRRSESTIGHAFSPLRVIAAVSNGIDT